MYKEATFEWVKSLFLTLTSKTYPYGFEDGLVYDMINLGIFPSDIQTDKFGNYYYQIGDSRTIFASHLDTNCNDQSDISHVISFDYDGNIIVETDGKTILGADDKAGVVILLWMIKNKIPGMYYFFIGEEVGCIGSSAASSEKSEFKGKYDRIISFDRRGTDSVITHQSSARTCSDKFAEVLSSKFNKFPNFSYKKDDSGIYTDSAEFSSIIPECTNISVGYCYEHTVREFQDLTHLSNLADVCITFDWENLPTLRDPSKYEAKDYGFYQHERDYSSYGRVGGKKSTRTNIYSSPNYSLNNKKKRSRRKSTKKIYLDGGNGDLKDISRKEIFRWPQPEKNDLEDIKSDKYGLFKYTFDKLSSDEIEEIKETYLDWGDDCDRKYYEYMKNNLTS